jgi:hypothetical protein
MIMETCKHLSCNLCSRTRVYHKVHRIRNLAFLFIYSGNCRNCKVHMHIHSHADILTTYIHADTCRCTHHVHADTCNCTHHIHADRCRSMYATHTCTCTYLCICMHACTCTHTHLHVHDVEFLFLFSRMYPVISYKQCLGAE